MKKLFFLCGALCTLFNVGCEQLKNDEQNIVFKDQLVKQICIENWDANSDGELSYNEAASVTTVNEIFEETNIVSFDSDFDKIDKGEKAFITRNKQRKKQKTER